MGNNNSPGYTGIPYWTVIDVNKKDKTALVLSEFVWEGNQGYNWPYEEEEESEEIEFEGANCETDWEHSHARDWCEGFYKDVLNNSSIIKKTRKTDAAYTSEDGWYYGTCKVDDYVFFLSASKISPIVGAVVVPS